MNAAAIIAPEEYNPLPLKSAFSMSASNFAGSLPTPKMIVAKDLLA